MTHSQNILVTSKKQIQEDLRISENLADESRKTPILHNTYNVLLLNLSNVLATKTIQFKKLYKQKHEYYSGRASSEVYKENPFPLKILKTDLHIYLDQDEELSVLSLEIEQIKNEIKFIEETIKQINQRTFHIKNSIDYLKFINGEH